MSDEREPRISIEVVYAERDRQSLRTLDVADGTTAAEALELSGLKELFPDADFDGAPLGVWGEPVGPGHRLRDGDRLEVYRPLAMEPREARRRLAARGSAMGKKPGSG